MQSPSHTPSTPTRPQTPIQAPALRVKTHVKAGDLGHNHNETLVWSPRPAVGLQVKSRPPAKGTARLVPYHDGR